MKLSQRLKIGKVIVSIVWLFIVASVIEPSQVPFPIVFQALGIALVVSHIIEIVVFKKKNAQASRLYINDVVWLPAAEDN